MITIMISGKQGSGKSTTAMELNGVLMQHEMTSVVRRFAEPLYQMHDKCLAVLSEFGIQRPELKKDGVLLQLLGTEWGRNSIDTNIWVKCLDSVRSRHYSYRGDVFIVEDLRFKNEFDGVSRDLGNVLTVRLECPKEIRMQRCSMWRPNDTHPSEIDLDDYVAQKKFDLVFDTSQESTELIVSEIMRRVQDGRIFEEPGLGPESAVQSRRN